MYKRQAQPRLLGPKLNPNDLDEEGRKKAEAVLIDSIDEAEYMGAKGIAFLAGKWEPETKDQAYAQLLKTTRAVCSYAASKKMMVELEVFDFDMDKAALIGPAPYAARFAADMRMTHNNFGLLVDLLSLIHIFQLFHVWCDRNVSVRRAGIYPYKERIPNSAHAAFLCIGKAFGVQYAQGIYDLRRQPGHFLYKTDHLCADADFPGIYICTRYQGSYKESKIKGLTVLP